MTRQDLFPTNETALHDVDRDLDRDRDAQTQRLSAAIRRILDGRTARRGLSPDGIGRDDGGPLLPSTDEPPVEWALRLMF
jgi:hypothetical protein